MPVLREIGGPHVYPLRGAGAIIGRSPDCDVVIGVRKVSAKHARIAQDGAQFFVEDLGSSNGTFVNGRRISSRLVLRPGDRLELFGVVLEYQVDGADAGAGPGFTLIETPAVAGTASVMSAVDVTDVARVSVAPEAKLRAVLEFSRNLSGTLDLKEVPQKILESLFAIFPQADRGFVLLRDSGTGRLLPKAVRHRRPNAIESPAISRTVLDHALKTGHALLSADAGLDERFDTSQSVRQHQIRSIMCVPMLAPPAEALGVIQLDTQSFRSPFEQDDLDVFAIAALQAARAVELARLHLERRDLEAATQIQKSFLPDQRPTVPGLHFFDHYVAAQQIGGDYFDYIRLPGDRLAVAVGDVAGKGVPAALLMARLSAEVRFSLAAEPSLAIAVQNLNVALKRACGEDRFITFVVIVIDLTTFRLTLVNAGHLPPLRRAADGSIDLLGDGSAGIPLGIFDQQYEEVGVELRPGDTIILATDGVTEARNPDNDLYGMERLRATLASAPPDADSASRAVLDDVTIFAGGRAAGDDLTLVCVSRDA